MVVLANNQGIFVKNRMSKVPEERNRDKLDKLVAENRKLRKEVAQLKKQLARVYNREEEIKEIMEEYEQAQAEDILPTKKPQCPQCGSYDVLIMEKLMNNVDYFSCNGCGGRGKVR